MTNIFESQTNFLALRSQTDIRTKQNSLTPVFFLHDFGM